MRSALSLPELKIFLALAGVRNPIMQYSKNTTVRLCAGTISTGSPTDAYKERANVFLS